MDQGDQILSHPPDPGSPLVHDVFAGQRAYFVVYRPGYQGFCVIFFYSCFFICIFI